jgi:GH15 family glucan-1,4-alpha-glucosidase
MARDIPLGNGSLLVTFDADYRPRDFYFPYVGQENHTAGHPCRFGFFVDGRFSWVGPDWRKALDYADDTLMTKVTLRHEALALDVACRDVVDFHENVFLREVRITNRHERPRLIKTFFSHDFRMGENDLGNTAFYDPQLKAVIHYRGPRYVLINVSLGGQYGVDEWATGTKEFRGLEGTWRDAEDGRLGGNPIAQGSVDSTIAVTVSVDAYQRVGFYYWIAAGTRFRDVAVIDAVVRDKGPAELIERTAHYWRAWLVPGRQTLPPVSPALQRLYCRSLLIMRTHMNHNGAVIAASDSDVLQFGRDTYSYMWPRDGALTAVGSMRVCMAPLPSGPSRPVIRWCARPWRRCGSSCGCRRRSVAVPAIPTIPISACRQPPPSRAIPGSSVRSGWRSTKSRQLKRPRL